jgi:hypothetical protein
MAYAAGCGYPTPVVHRAHGADMVLERLTGPTMLQAVTAGELHPGSAGELLADLLRRLHALPPRPGAAPTDSLLHLDLHPENVMLTPTGPMVIDWRNATDGPADLDVAVSALIIAQAAVDPVHPVAAPAGSLLTAFLRATPGDPVRLLDSAVAVRHEQLGDAEAETALLTPAAERIRAVHAG